MSKPPRDLCLGQSVVCVVWELLSLYDTEGTIIAIDGDICTVRFYSCDKKIHRNALEKR